MMSFRSAKNGISSFSAHIYNKEGKSSTQRSALFYVYSLFVLAEGSEDNFETEIFLSPNFSKF